MNQAIRREPDGWWVTPVAALIGFLGVVYAAILGRRGNAETKFYDALLARVTALEGKVERLEAELDEKSQAVLVLSSERDGLLRENKDLTARCVQLSARNLELEAVVAGIKLGGYPQI